MAIGEFNMPNHLQIAHTLSQKKKAEQGFTLIEVLVAMTVMAIVTMPLASSYFTQKRAAARVRQTAQMQQQLRGAVYAMERDIRLQGFYDATANKDLIDDFGVIDVRRYTITDADTAPTANGAGWPSLSLTSDWNTDNPSLSMDGAQNDPVVSYRLFDETGDGIFELARDVGATRTLLSENIQAIGFAYAYDGDNASDSDGQLDRTAAGNIRWAVDTNNDNLLDTNLDTNDDGVIDLADDSDGNLLITSADNAAGALPALVPVTNIRMVRVWLLARAPRQTTNYTNSNSYVVGDRIVAGNNDGFMRRALDRVIVARNMGL
jgi:type IV pilus assembly protein PilW